MFIVIRAIMTKIWLVLFALIWFSPNSAFAAGLKLIKATDAHEILGIKRDSSLFEAQRAYRKLMMKYHPDRHTGASKKEQSIAEENMKRCKAAYEAIETGDVSKMRFFEGTLGGTSSSPNIDIEPPFDFDGAPPEGGSHDNNDLFEDLNVFFGQPRSKETALATHVPTLFDRPIVAVYENESGTIIETFLGEFYWIGQNSSVAYPMFFGPSLMASPSKYGERRQNLTVQLFDARLPGGFIPFEIRNGLEVKVENLTFHHTDHVLPHSFKQLNEKMANLGLKRFSKETPTHASLNIWDYFVYKNEDQVIIVATADLGLERRQVAGPKPSTPKNHAPSRDVRQWSKALTTHTPEAKKVWARMLVRVFVGREGAMQELRAYHDSDSRYIVVPQRDWIIGLAADAKFPHYDKTNGLFMGMISHTKGFLRITHKGSILDVPAVDERFLREFSLVKWLGEFISPPVLLRTPLDSIFNNEIHFTKVPLSPPQTAQDATAPNPASLSSTTAIVVQADVAASKAAQNHDERVRHFEFVQSAREVLSYSASNLDLPEGDARRVFVETFARKNPDFEELKALTIKNIANEDFSNMLVNLLVDMKDFDRLRPLMPLYKLLTEFYEKQNDIGSLAAFGAALARHFANRDDPGVSPILRRLILYPAKPVQSFMWRPFGSEEKMREWARGEGSACNDLLGPGPTPAIR